MTYLEVADEIEKFIEGRGDDWDWDNFITGKTFKDPYLRAVQQRMSGLSNEFPPVSRGHYCSPEGLEVMRLYIEELRLKAKDLKEV